MPMTSIEREIVDSTGRPSLELALDHLAAEHLASAKCLTTPVDIVKLAISLGVQSVTVADLPCDAALIPTGKAGYRVLLSRWASANRRRFSLAHELAHVILQRIIPQTRSFETRSVFMPPGAKAEERICDGLAAKLLMPTPLFSADVSDTALSIDGLQRLATKYSVSLAAAAWRYRDQRKDLDFGVASLSRNREGGDVSFGRVLVNFETSPLRPDSRARYNGESVPARAFALGRVCRGWDWFRQRLLRRRLYFFVKPATRASSSGLAILSKQELP